MFWLDFELELESHELRRSLLFMVRDDDVGLDNLLWCIDFNAPPNPFDVIWERFPAIDMAF